LIQYIINILYRYPKAKLKKIGKFGGFNGYLQMLYDKNLMEKASSCLPPIMSYPDGLPIYFLTGTKYLYQTLFCIRSLNQHSTEKFKFIIVDDGSLNAKLFEQIRRQLPGAVVIVNAEIEQNVERNFPKNSYPTLRNKRKEYPHIKKLTDIHSLPDVGWKLVLDSDMLFWDTPTEIIKWLKNPDRPIHMTDCEDSYGYSRGLMEQLAGAKIPPLLNVGVIGLNSSKINWNEVENWVKILEEKENKTYYMEQALSAMLVANTNCVVLDAKKYIVNPNDKTISKMNGILHHYVDLSKKKYYTMAWRKHQVV
jgi:hypothetical protein